MLLSLHLLPLIYVHNLTTSPRLPLGRPRTLGCSYRTTLSPPRQYCKTFGEHFHLCIISKNLSSDRLLNIYIDMLCRLIIIVYYVHFGHHSHYERNNIFKNSAHQQRKN